MTAFPEIEMWSDNGPMPDAALVAMIEASNAYAFAEFHDPVNQIYTDMLMSVAPYLPQLLAIAVEYRKAMEAQR